MFGFPNEGAIGGINRKGPMGVTKEHAAIDYDETRVKRPALCNLDSTHLLNRLSIRHVNLIKF
jgi:hypothetical protein